VDYRDDKMMGSHRSKIIEKAEKMSIKSIFYGGGYRTSFAVGLLDIIAFLPNNSACLLSKYASYISPSAATLPQGVRYNGASTSVPGLRDSGHK